MLIASHWTRYAPNVTTTYKPTYYANIKTIVEKKNIFFCVYDIFLLHLK